MAKKILLFTVAPLLIFLAAFFLLYRRGVFSFAEVQEAQIPSLSLEDDELIRSFDSTFQNFLFKKGIAFTDSLIERKPSFWVKNYKIPADMSYPRMLQYIREVCRGYNFEIMNTYLNHNETVMNVVVGRDNVNHLQFVFSNTEELSKHINVAVVFFNFGHGELVDELKILRLPLKLNVAVAPFFSNSDTIVAESVKRGHELILYMPMEPKFHPVLGGSARDIEFSNYVEEHGIVVTHTPEVVKERLKRAVNYFSPAKISGITNFRGFKIIRKSSIMNTIVQYANKNDLYFLYKESLEYPGISDIKAMSTKEGGVVVYDFFIDSRNNPDAIRETFERAVAHARRTGNVVIIARPSEHTYNFFSNNLKRFEEEKIDFIFLTSLVSMRK